VSAGRWARLKSLFNVADDLSQGGRHRFIDAVSDPSIAAELKRLLDRGDDLSGSFLEGRSWIFGPPVDEPATRSLTRGEVVNGRFEISQFLGAGGMGEVYEAFDTEVNERIALKTLRPDVATLPGLTGSLRKELQIARRISHPNVCRSFDLNRTKTPDGVQTVFITMELLEGRTLAEVVHERPYPVEEALPIVRQLLSGLGAAHHCGIIHRDFKSGNIMLVSEANGGTRAVITDFGLARDAATARADAGTLSAPGAMVGTPAYMSPEQLQGLPLTLSADIYAIGVVIFEMLTGRLPFEGSTPLAIALKRLRTDAPSPREFLPGLPAHWNTTIMACLDREPNRRPRDTEEIGRMLLGEQVIRRRWSRRGIAGGAAAAGIAATLTYIAREQRTVNPEAERSFKRAEEFAKGRALEDLKSGLQEYESALRLEPEYAEALAGMADTYSSMVNFGFMSPMEGLDRARAAAAKAVEIKPRMARGHGSLGYVISMDVRRWLSAEPHFRRAVELNAKEPTVRRAYGAHLGRLGRFNEAIAQVKMGLNEDPFFLPLNHQLAAEYFRARRFEEFHAQSLEVVRLQPRDGQSHLALARSFEWRREFEQALRSLTEAEKFGQTMMALCQRGCIAAWRGNLPVGRDTAERLESYWKKNSFSAFQLAILWFLSGQSGRATAVLKAGFDRQDSTILAAPTSPYFDGLKNDPEFREFSQTLGLNG